MGAGTQNPRLARLASVAIQNPPVIPVQYACSITWSHRLWVPACAGMTGVAGILGNTHKNPALWIPEKALKKWNRPWKLRLIEESCAGMTERGGHDGCARARRKEGRESRTPGHSRAGGNPEPQNPRKADDPRSPGRLAQCPRGRTCSARARRGRPGPRR